MPQAFSEWQYLDPMAQQTGGVPGAASKTYPIRGNGPEPWFRDHLDATRSARIPTAEYPDGYVGTTNTRRESRIQSGGQRPYQTMRNYQRGIHVGARVLPSAYFWTDEVDPMAGLRAQSEGKKWTQQGEYITHLTNDGKAGPVRGSISMRDPVRDQTVPPRLYPRWK